MADTPLTEETAKNLDNALNNLNKTLEKTNASYLEISSKTKEIKDNTESVNKTLEKKSGKLLDGLYSTLDKMVESSESIVGMITGGSLIASLGTIAKHAWDLNDSMTKLSVRMGQGREHAKDLEGSVTGMMKSFGSNYDQAKEIVETLAQAKYADNLQDAAAGADLFARATGASVGTVVQLTDALNKQAGMSAKSSNAILAGMTKIQQTVGISHNGMEALASSINDMALNMAAFGKSSEEIQRAAVKTTALAGAMEKVGVSAQRAVALMDQLSDPDRIEDNILLYSQLGISIEDALNGGVQEALEGDAFKEMAEKITAMGPIAGSAMAKSMGLSYKEVSRMAQMETGSMNDLVDEATIEEDKALDKLDEFAKETEGLGAKIKRFFNQLQGWIMGLGPILLTALTVVAPQILKLFKGLVDKITGREAIQASVKTTGEILASTESGILSRFRNSGIENLKGARDEGFTNVQRHIAANKNELTALAGVKGENGKALIGENGEASDDATLSLADKKLQKQLVKQYQKLKLSSERWENLLGESGKNQLDINKKQEELNKATEGEKSSEQEMLEHSKRISELKEMQKNATGEMVDTIKNRIIKEQEALNTSIEANESFKKTTAKITKELNDLQNGNASPEIAKKYSLLGKIGQGIGTRISSTFQGVKNSLAEKGDGSVGIGIAKTAGGAIKSIAKNLGPMAIVMGIVSKILDKVKEPLSNLADNLIGILGDWFEPMLKTFVDLLNTMAKTLLPPILYVLSGVLDALHFLLTPLIWLLKSLEKIPVVGKTLAGVGDMLDSITGSGQDLRDSAKKLAGSNDDLTKAVSKNTDVTETANEEPPIIEVVGGEAVMTSGNAGFVNESVGSTTQTTQTVTTDEEKNKEAKKESREKAQTNELVAQTESLKNGESYLAKIARLLEEWMNSTKTTAFTGQTFSLNSDK